MARTLFGLWGWVRVRLPLRFVVSVSLPELFNSVNLWLNLERRMSVKHYGEGKQSRKKGWKRFRFQRKQTRTTKIPRERKNNTHMKSIFHLPIFGKLFEVKGIKVRDAVEKCWERTLGLQPQLTFSSVFESFESKLTCEETKVVPSFGHFWKARKRILQYLRQFYWSRCEVKVFFYS